ATRSRSSSLIEARTALPSRIRALTWLFLPFALRSPGSVREVPRAGEVHGHAGRLRRLDDLHVPLRPAGGDDRTHTRVEQDLQTVGEGEEGVRGGDGPLRPLLAGPGDRQVAGVDAVDLAHADADRGPAA